MRVRGGRPEQPWKGKIGNRAAASRLPADGLKFKGRAEHSRAGQEEE